MDNGAEYREADRELRRCTNDLRLLCRLDEDVLEKLMDLVATSGTDDANLRKLLREYEDATIGIKTWAAAVSFWTEQEGVSNDKS
jgi:hypothetical protein